MSHDLYVQHGSFSPDGSRLVTIDEGLGVQVWDLASGQQINLPDHSRRTGSAQPFSGGAWAWDLPADERRASELALLTQLLSGRRIDGVSGLVPLDREQLKARWQEWSGGGDQRK